MQKVTARPLSSRRHLHPLRLLSPSPSLSLSVRAPANANLGKLSYACSWQMSAVETNGQCVLRALELFTTLSHMKIVIKRCILEENPSAGWKGGKKFSKSMRINDPSFPVISTPIQFRRRIKKRECKWGWKIGWQSQIRSKRKTECDWNILFQYSIIKQDFCAKSYDTLRSSKRLYSYLSAKFVKSITSWCDDYKVQFWS